MKKLAITLSIAALMIPAVAHAGHYGQQGCQSASTMTVECTNGVKIYRAQPIQYAPGHLERQVRMKTQAKNVKKMQAQHHQFKRKLEKQNMKIAALEEKISKLKQDNQPRRRRGFIQGVGFGSNFLSPQRAPGFNNLRPGPAFRSNGPRYHK